MKLWKKVIYSKETNKQNKKKMDMQLIGDYQLSFNQFKLS